MDDKVWVVGFELKSNPMDDYGVECVCDSEESAMVEIAVRSSKTEKYKYFIWGDYFIRRLVPLGN